MRKVYSSRCERTGTLVIVREKLSCKPHVAKSGDKRDWMLRSTIVVFVDNTTTGHKEFVTRWCFSMG
jgi:hypothetical protein